MVESKGSLSAEIANEPMALAVEWTKLLCKTSDKLERRRSVMAALDWSQCQVVESIPGKISGAWVFRGTRTPVAVVFVNLEDGDGRRSCGAIPRDPVKHLGS